MFFSDADSLKAFGTTIRGLHRKPHVTPKSVTPPPTRVYNGRTVNDWTAVKETLGNLKVGELRTVELPPAFRQASAKRNMYSCGVRRAICTKERRRWRLEIRSGENPYLLYVTRIEDWDYPPTFEPIEQTPEIDIEIKSRVYPAPAEELPLKRIEPRVKIKPGAERQQAIDAQDWKSFIPADPPEAQQLLEASIRYSGPVKQTEEEYTDLFDNIMPELGRKVALHRQVKEIVDGVFGDWIKEHKIDGFIHPEQFRSLFGYWQRKVTDILAPKPVK